ncbi:alpha/beta hydrolase [Planctomicrobium sp. SH661]|uniref:alpha/beta hydrolase n=1 Tax=Planctomicrobium sp. SH661 TaxID=3448124 RepID=UPI003F5B7318
MCFSSKMVRSALLPIIVLTAIVCMQDGNSRAYAESPAGQLPTTGVSYRTDDGSLDDYAKSQCRMDLFIPEGKKDFPTVIWFHGGGLTAGEKSIPDALKNRGIAVVAVGYRLSPKVPVTTCVDDAAAATAWTLRKIKEYGGSPDKVVISGASAGGYLALMVGLDPKWLAKYGCQPNQLAGLAPFTGHTITHFTARSERGIPNTRPVVDEMAPLYHVRADAPPILLMTGDRELEMLGRYEENAYLYRMLKVVGHRDVTLMEFPGTDHGGMVVPAYPHLLEFVERVTK